LDERERLERSRQVIHEHERTAVRRATMRTKHESENEKQKERSARTQHNENHAYAHRR
jgi:hypothetical protein